MARLDIYLKYTFMKMKFTLFSLFVLAVASGRTMAQSEGDYRSVPAGGNWSASTTWERFTSGVWTGPATPPTSTDGVIDIVSGSPVIINSAVTMDQVVIESGGTLTVSSSSTIADGTGTDVDVLSGGTFNIAAALSFSGTMNNAGTINWSVSSVTFAGGTLTNSGQLNITGNSSFLSGSGTNLLSNTSGGTIAKSGGAGASDIRIPFTNAGTINISNNALRTFSPSVFTNTGSINITGGTAFNGMSGSWVLNTGTAVTGNGTFQMPPTAINLPLTLPVGISALFSGDVTGTGGSLTVNGSLTWSFGALRIPATIATGAVLTIDGTTSARILNAAFVQNGTASWLSGDFTFNNASFTNGGTLTINFSGTDHSIARFATSTNSFTNTGTINKTDVSTLTFTSVPMSSSGTLSGVGTMNFAGTAPGGLTNTGTVSVGPDASTAGALTINPQAVSSGSTVAIKLRGTGAAGAANGYDQMTFTDNTDLSGATLTITDNDPATPPGVYTILTTSSGTFSNSFATVNKPVNFDNPVVSGNTVTINKAYTLPVIWGDLSVKKAEGGVQVNWQTMQESNTSYFGVERAPEGGAYATIGKVTAAGNSSLPISYSFTDVSPVKGGKSSYRLKQVDLDGRFVYSKVLPLELPAEVSAYVNIYPVPFVSTLNINVFADNIDAGITDVSGRRIKFLSRLSAGLHVIPTGDLQAGTYTITLYKAGKAIASQQISKL